MTIIRIMKFSATKFTILKGKMDRSVQCDGGSQKPPHASPKTRLVGGLKTDGSAKSGDVGGSEFAALSRLEGS